VLFFSLFMKLVTSETFALSRNASTSSIITKAGALALARAKTNAKAAIVFSPPESWSRSTPCRLPGGQKSKIIWDSNGVSCLSIIKRLAYPPDAETSHFVNSL